MTERIDLHSLLTGAIIQNVQAFTDFVHLLLQYEHRLYVKQKEGKYDLWVLTNPSKGRPRTTGRVLGSLFIVEQNVHLYLFPLLKPAPFAALLTTTLTKVMHGRYAFRISEFDPHLKRDLQCLLDKLILSLAQYTDDEK